MAIPAAGQPCPPPAEPPALDKALGWFSPVTLVCGGCKVQMSTEVCRPPPPLPAPWAGLAPYYKNWPRMVHGSPFAGETASVYVTEQLGG